MSSQRNRNLLFWIALLQGAVFYGSIASIYRLSHGLTLKDIFLFESVSIIISIAAELPWGILADRIGARKTFIIGNGLFFLSKIIFFLAGGYALFLLERIVLGIALSALSGCDSALIYESSGDKGAEKAFARIEAAQSIGIVSASLLSPLIIAHSMRQCAFWTMIGYGIAFLLSLFLHKGQGQKERQPFHLGILLETLKNRPLLLYLSAGALLIETAQSLIVFLSQAQYERAGIPLRWYGPIFAGLELLPLLGSTAPRLKDCMGERKLIPLLFLLQSGGLLLLALGASVLSTLAGMLCCGVSIALFHPVNRAKLVRLSPRESRVSRLSIYSLFSQLTAAALNPCIGAGADISLPGSLYALSFSALVAGLMMALSLRRL